MRKRRGKGRARFLYDLPWYVIIGPPGCGKTTALVHSGINFPLAEQFGKQALRGVGGTRDCDWWFTDEAVLLDTAGRYVTQDSHAELDSAAWGGFLSLLKKHRRRRPINGVLVAMSMSDLMVESEQERQAHVRAIRSRIQELRKQLGIQFPVYMMLTKSDLVAGFMEFFDDLGREERAQVWGITFPLQGQGPAAALERLHEEFDGLMQRLNDRMVGRLHAERDPGRRALIYGFPQQLAGLRETVEGFVQDVFRPNQYEEPVMLRGLYFSSGTQQGSPIDRLMGSLARTFGFDRQVLPAHGGQGRSYFLTNLLRQVIFQEAEIAGTNRRLELRLAWLQRVGYLAILLASVGAVIGWAASFGSNKAFLGEVQAELGRYQKVAEAPVVKGAGLVDVLPRLDAARALSDTANQYAQDIPLHMRLGLYQGKSAGNSARDAYLRELNALLTPLIAARLGEQLASGAGGVDFQYEALKTYLMLGDAERLDPEQIRLWMHLDWANSFRDRPDVQDRLRTHLASLLGGGVQPLALDPALVQSARARLKQVPLSQFVYGQLKRELTANDKNPFRVSDAVGPMGDRVFQRASGKGLDEGVPGLFTYRGYYSLYKTNSGNLVDRFRKENWVLGIAEDDLGKVQLEQLDEQVGALYYADYTRSWQELLKDLRIVPLVSIAQAQSVLDVLSSPTSPLKSLLQAVDRETSLTRLPGKVGKLAEVAGQFTRENRLSRVMSAVGKEDVAPESPAAVVEQNFERLNALVRSEGGPAPIDSVIGLLSELYGELSTTGVMPGTAMAGGSDILRRFKVEAARQPEPVKSWLEQLAGGAQGVQVGSQRAQINAALGSDVVPSCRTMLDGRYPYDRASRQDVNLNDFGRLFGPGGILDGFFTAQLKPFVDTTGRIWSWRPGFSGSPGTLAQFQRAERIRETFFAAGGAVPAVNFGLKPVSLDNDVTQFFLDLGGQKFTYRHGPVRVSNAQWPSPEGQPEVRIVFEDDKGNSSTLKEEGPWAWFRILDRAKTERVSSDRLLVTFEAGGHKAQYEVQASSVRNPFSMEELDRFRCPSGL